MNKKLLSLLLVIPFAATQMYAVTEVSLGNTQDHAQDTLSNALLDAQSSVAKIQTLIDLKNEFLKVEVASQDALERTAELHPNNPARRSALAVQNLVKSIQSDMEMMHKKLALSVQEAKNVVNAFSEKCKKSNQTLLEAMDTFNNALKQVRNPKEGMAAQ